MSALERYKTAAQALADLTLPKCMTCRTAKPTRCCGYEHCMLTTLFMDDYAENVELKAEIAPFLVIWRDAHADPSVDPTETIPFMGTSGCIVPPHLRPNCTSHQCDINSIGVFKGDPAGTNVWFQLYDEMNTAFQELVDPGEETDA